MRFWLRLAYSFLISLLVMRYVPAPWCWVWVGVIVFAWVLVLLWAFVAAGVLGSFGRRH